MLHDLERTNLFLIPLDDEQRRYRYHHLFADALRARLARGPGPRLPSTAEPAPGTAARACCQRQFSTR
jgi:ATP/maltotriose-dependent transcriptional regulator MalT